MKTDIQHLTFAEFDSSTIKKSAYNHISKEFTIEFKSGIYVYENVDEDTFNKFTYSDSQGKVFNTLIKDKYKFRKV